MLKGVKINRVILLKIIIIIKITTRGNIIKTDTNIYTNGMCGRI